MSVWGTQSNIYLRSSLDYFTSQLFSVCLLFQWLHGLQHSLCSNSGNRKNVSLILRWEGTHIHTPTCKDTHTYTQLWKRFTTAMGGAAQISLKSRGNTDMEPLKDTTFNLWPTYTQTKPKPDTPKWKPALPCLLFKTIQSATPQPVINDVMQGWGQINFNFGS